MKPECPDCKGAGKLAYESGRYLGTCGTCKGTGRRKLAELICKTCNGSGNDQGACIDCAGTGRKYPEEKL